MRGRWAVLAGAVVAVLAVPPVAGAATKTVEAGPAAQDAPKFQDAFGDDNAFLRRAVTIRRGDRVRWNINGFHTVTFVPGGEEAPALIVPDLAAPITGVLDAAGLPFWFNGQPSLRLNPLVALPQGGKRYSPTQLLNSGLPLGQGPPKPYTLRFNRTGSFTYYCIVHPGMTGKVRVRSRGKAIPTARQDRRAKRRETATALRAVQRLTTGAGLQLDKTIQAGNDRRWGPTVFKFFPAQPAYKVGDTVTLQMPPASTEAHTFSFGPTNGRDAYLDQLAANLVGEAFDPRGGYPSDPPPGAPYTGTNHGNGFWNSGIMDSDPNTVLPEKVPITFAAPGSFTFICLIHPFMTGTVTVTP